MEKNQCIALLKKSLENHMINSNIALHEITLMEIIVHLTAMITDLLKIFPNSLLG